MVYHVYMKKISSESLHLDALPRNTKKAFLECTKFSFFNALPWYLAGGTALALQTGHRQSVDLDFFLPRIGFKERIFERKLLATRMWQTTYVENGTIFGTLLGAKMSFIAYPFFVPRNERLAVGNIKLLLPNDIAAMKIMAISQRGRKRDFLDLYWYCLNYASLSEVIRNAMHQFPGQEKNLNHILRSLTYFDDAEGDPMPKIFFKVSWAGIKAYFRREAVKATKMLLQLR